MKLNNSGIYTITSPSGGQYIGSAVNIRLRWHTHKIALRKGTHRNPKLQNAWNKHGEENIEFAIYELCGSLDLLIYEQRAIDKLKPRYNICKVAGNTLGLKWSEESKKRQSERLYGSKHTDETRAKMSASHTGKTCSEETKIKVAAQRGWKHSEESKNKMRNRIRTDEHRINLSTSLVGRAPAHVIPHSEETKQKISKTLTGRKLSAVTRAKMSVAQQLRRNQKSSVDYQVD